MSSEGIVKTRSAPDAGKLKLFISYSRADLAFADELTAGLEYDGAFEVAIDRHSIIEGEDWKKRLGALIADADTIGFLLSPKSAASDICRWEVDEAVRLTKRIVPVLVAPLGAQPAPAALAALNFVRFDSLEDSRPRSFMAGLTALVRALKSDLGWLREHTRLLARASEWAEAGRAANRLLTGDAVPDAKAWAARRPKDAPALNALHLEFITASEQAETLRQGEAAQALAERERLVSQAEAAAREREAALDQQRSALRRSARLQWVASGLFLVVIAGLLARMNEQQLRSGVYWANTFYGHTNTAADIAKLKPGDTFAECKDGFSTDREDGKKIHASCPDMVVIPAGEFMMGSPETEKNRGEDEALHGVTIAKPFAVSKYSITFDQWDACVAGGGCEGYRPSDSNWGRGSRPVINVNWLDARQYVDWLNRMTGGKTYRLLTEAEWEYAARAGSQARWSFGDDEEKLKDFAWYGENSESRTQPVGLKKPNAFGLYDMHGNVWQWVQDFYVDDYKKVPADGTSAPDEPNCRRLVRGGSWYNNPQLLRSAYRFGSTTDNRVSLIGFRVGRTLSP